jgi:hypothetical protein
MPAETLAPTLMRTVEEAVAGLVPNVPVIPVGQPDADRVTGKLKPPAPVIVTAEFPAEPAVAVADVAARVKLGCGPVFTAKAILVLADNVPLVPLTGSEYEPGATFAATLIVATEEAVAGFVPNDPVMPAGHPVVERVTPELKPFAGFTLTVDVPVAPGFTDAAVELRVKLGRGPPLTGPKKIPLATAPAEPSAVTVIVTFPRIVQTP